MQITLKLFANFRIGRFKIKEFELTETTTCEDMIRTLDIPLTEIGIVLVNGRHAGLAQTLNEGDNLALFPLVGGG
jgi:molybdopterin converting factor small subunit